MDAFGRINHAEAFELVQARIAELEEALRPFARECDHIDATGSRRLEDHEYAPYRMQMEPLRRARAALKEQEQGS